MRHPLIACGLASLFGGLVLVYLTWNVGAARWFPPDDVPSIAQFHSAKSTGVEWRWVTETNRAVANSTRHSSGAVSIDVAVEAPMMKYQDTQAAAEPRSKLLYRKVVTAGQRSPTGSRRPADTFQVFVPSYRSSNGEACPALLNADVAALGARIFAELSVSDDFSRSQKRALQGTETLLRSPETMRTVSADVADCVYSTEAG